MSHTSGFTQITTEKILAVRGNDAKNFLQGQLTCNLGYIDNNRSSLGARCTPKGRMQSSFRILTESDGYLLAIQQSIFERQLAELKKFAIFSKSSLIDESEQWVRFGLINGQTALDELGITLAAEAGSVTRHNDLIAVRVSNSLCELWLKSENAGCQLKRLRGLLDELDENSWQLELIRCGIGQISENTFESFIPQMINLPALDGVSFKKGCYTGQEIVARMQFLGKLKRHMHRFAMKGQQAPQPSTQIFLTGKDNAIGEVVNAARTATGIELLAVVLDEAAENADNAAAIRLGSADGEVLQVLDLPYSINTEKELQR